MAEVAPTSDVQGLADDRLAECLAVLRPDSSLPVKSVRAEIQARMSDRAGILCDADGVRDALEEARSLNTEIRSNGISYGHQSEAVRSCQWQQMALASEAVLTALDYYIRNGGGSRGARAICDPSGEAAPDTRTGSLEQYRFRKERDEHKAEQIVVSFDGKTMSISTRPNRSFDEEAKSFFERDWPDWLTGRIYGSAVARE
jgi:hypothetical protein